MIMTITIHITERMEEVRRWCHWIVRKLNSTHQQFLDRDDRSNKISSDVQFPCQVFFAKTYVWYDFKSSCVMCNVHWIRLESSIFIVTISSMQCLRNHRQKEQTVISITVLCSACKCQSHHDDCTQMYHTGTIPSHLVDDTMGPLLHDTEYISCLELSGRMFCYCSHLPRAAIVAT